MVRNSLSGVVGGIGLILSAVGLAAGVRWPLIGLGVLLIAASTIGFLWDWLKPKSVRPPSTGYTVTSHQQSGGITAAKVAITAHTVNLASQPRSFQGHDLTELRNYLAQFAGTSTMIDCDAGSGEAASFAQELKALLESTGWTARLRMTQGFPIRPPGVGFKLDSALPWVTGFESRLAAMGFKTYPLVNAHSTEVYVGRL